jgi:hypothetical protein
MKRWSLAITAAYALILLAITMPAMVVLTHHSRPELSDFRQAYGVWEIWISIAILLFGQAVLLWLSADTTRRRLRPRTSVAMTAALAGFFLMVLTLAAGIAFILGVWGESSFPNALSTIAMITAILIPWLFWGLLFYRFYRNSEDPVTRAVQWLLRGSVLELLIAVPAHVITRRRDDCCAPAITGLGITCGIAIMILSFGPSVLFLFKKRIEQSKSKHAVAI